MDKFAALDMTLTKVAIAKLAEETGLSEDQVVEAVESNPEAAATLDEEKKAALNEIISERALQKIAAIAQQGGENFYGTGQSKLASFLQKLAIGPQMDFPGFGYERIPPKRIAGHGIGAPTGRLAPADTLTKMRLEQAEARGKNLSRQFNKAVADARELSKALMNKEHQLESFTGSRLARAGRWLGTHPKSSAAIAAATLAGLGGAGYGAYRMGRKKAAAHALAEMMSKQASNSALEILINGR